MRGLRVTHDLAQRGRRVDKNSRFPLRQRPSVRAVSRAKNTLGWGTSFVRKLTHGTTAPLRRMRMNAPSARTSHLAPRERAPRVRDAEAVERHFAELETLALRERVA
jgi:hypothetical protein